MELARDEDRWDMVMMAVFTGAAFILLLPLIQQAVVSAQQAQGRVPVLPAGLDPVAGNAGAMWLETTPTGYPKELRVVTENSTGAFERVLVSRST